MKNKVLTGLWVATLAVAAAPAFAAGPFQYHAITPCRVVDTRRVDGVNGGPVVAGNTDTTPDGTQVSRLFSMKDPTGACGVPATADAVTVNFTIFQPTSLGHLRVFPGGSAPPTVSTINFQASNVIANGAIVPLGATATDDLGIYLYQATPGATSHVIIDVTGYFDN